MDKDNRVTRSRVYALSRYKLNTLIAASGLDRNERTVVSMAARGYTLDEMVTVTGIPKRTLSWIKYRTYKKLKESILL